MFAECNDYFLRFTMFNNGVVYKRSELIIFILHSLKADYKLDHNILSALCFGLQLIENRLTRRRFSKGVLVIKRLNVETLFHK